MSWRTDPLVLEILRFAQDDTRGARILRYMLALAAVLALASCEEMAEEVSAQAQRIPAIFPSGLDEYWRGDDVSGSPKIVVKVSEQRAYFYKGKKLVGLTTVSTGKRGFDTPPGRYHVTQKDKDHVSSEFGDYIDANGSVLKSNIDIRKDEMPRGARFDGARMPYFLRFNGGYGMHAGYVPRFRASHGCIRLPERMARHFFESAREDTPVIVKE